VSILEEQVNFFEKLFTSILPFPRFEHKCNYSPILRFTK
jgi:hypothetical protein